MEIAIIKFLNDGILRHLTLLMFSGYNLITFQLIFPSSSKYRKQYTTHLHSLNIQLKQQQKKAKGFVY